MSPPFRTHPPSHQAQLARRALMRERTLARLEDLAATARSSDFTIGARVKQPLEVQRLQRRVRAVSARWAPQWTSPAAAAAGPETRVHLEHVVPVIVLTERILQGDDVEAVLAQAVVCRVTHDEHKTHLEVAFRRVHRELYERMLSGPLDQLAELGWQRYHLVDFADCVEIAEEHD